MVLTVLTAAFFLMLSGDSAGVGRSAIAQQLMLSNVYFWRNTGYFEGSSDLMPLLHTWSLAVEEQFYLIYPVLLIVLRRFGRNTTFATLAIACVASLILSEYGVRHHPSATFYLLPTRAWELLIGSLIWSIPSPQKTHAVFHELLSWISLATILMTGCFYTDLIPFPGLSALLPCIAAAALIYSNSSYTSTPARLLAARPVVFIGLISYSLYLWHWPVLSFYRYIYGDKLTNQETAFSLLFSGIVSCAAWWLVESPMRRSVQLSKPRVVFASAGVAFLFMLLIAFGVASKQITWGRRQEAEYYRSFAQSFVRHEVSLAQANMGKFPAFGDSHAVSKVLLWGDSHAMAIAPALDESCRRLGICGYHATHSSTAPVLNFVSLQEFGLNQDAPAFNAAVLRFIKSEKIDCVVLSALWTGYEDSDSWANRFVGTVESILATGARVIIVLDVAAQRVNVPMYFAQRVLWFQQIDYRGLPDEEHREKNREFEAICVSSLTGNPNLTILDPGSALIDEEGFWFCEHNGRLMYRDNHHLSIDGALRLVDLFTVALETVNQDGDM